MHSDVSVTSAVVCRLKPDPFRSKFQRSNSTLYSTDENEYAPIKGPNARKVILEVYAFFVLQCTVLGRKSKYKADVKASHGISFQKNNL